LLGGAGYYFINKLSAACQKEGAMALYLVQHGKSLPREVDPEQGLSGEGFSDVERIAGVAKGYSVRVLSIKHSGKKRARQTAEIFAAALEPQNGVEKQTGLDPLDDVTALEGKLRSDENVMLVGHLPFMEKLTSYLVTGSTEKRIFKFQNGGIVCLDRELDSPSWFIKWSLMPKID
jgi:phosphohistidine phosphatase